jgi:hypothetical protein
MSQVKSLVLFLPRTIHYWFCMTRDRIKYGKRKGDQCGPLGCWVLIWESMETGAESVDHVSFSAVRRLAPTLDCFIYTDRHGCVRRWWGAHVWYTSECPESSFWRLTGRD